MPLPALLLLLALVGCAQAVPVTPTSAPTGSPATGTASPASAVPATIVIEAEGFSVLDSGGRSTIEFAWADDPGDIVTELDEVFGMRSSQSFQPGDGTHFADFDVYTWDAFSLSIARLGEMSRSDYFLPAAVEVRAEKVGGISIQTAAGLAVGSSVDQVRAAGVGVEEPLNTGGTAYRIDPSEPELIADLSEPTRTVQLDSDPENKTIVLLRAPALSFTPF
ncbi:hypothetical protein [Ruicaihuangia caeni]|uniref:hypothetical protein n=1 Tax=Ruicaihuangia caeni TaxID=3042517 RepID=UPI00248CD30E|nr:hypothetical protein [Klugiella sp. YN-L-19]